MQEFDGYATNIVYELSGAGGHSVFALPEDSAKNLIRQNEDLVDDGRRFKLSAEHVARQIVERAEAKGAKVPRQEPKQEDSDAATETED